jgi:hypothetical protein
MPTEDTVDDYMFTTVTPTNKPGGLDLAIYCQKMRASKLLTKMGFHELKKSNQGENKNHPEVPTWTIWLVWKPSSDGEQKQKKRKHNDDVGGRRKKERGEREENLTTMNEAKKGAAVKKERSLVKAEGIDFNLRREVSVKAELQGHRKQPIEEKPHGIPFRSTGSRTRAQKAHERAMAQVNSVSDAQQDEPSVTEREKGSPANTFGEDKYGSDKGEEEAGRVDDANEDVEEDDPFAFSDSLI